MEQLKQSLTIEDIPVMNFGQYMMEKMQSYSKEEAVVNGSTGDSYTYQELRSRTERLAAGLQRLGVRESDVICIFAPNHIDYLVAFYASTLINAIFQPANPLSTKDDLHKVLQDCNTKYIFTVADLVCKVQEYMHDLNHIKVIVFGHVNGYLSIDSVLAPAGTPVHIPAADWKRTTAALLSSSGTTGFPKAVQHSHFGLVANVMLMSAAGVGDNGDSLVIFLPMFHIYGLVGVCAIDHAQGCKIVFMARFNADEYIRLIQIYKPRILHLVPPIMVMLVKHPKVSEYDLSSVKRIVCGAAPLSAEIEEAVKNKLKLKSIHQAYGGTEQGLSHFGRDGDYRTKSVGKPLDLTEMKIIDVDTGKELGPHGEGEIWIRGPQVCTGYLNLPAQTKELFTDDGWIKTGDIGKVDEDGFLFIVDRLKELIKYKGYQVAPASLEDILLGHKAVADVGVIGIPDEEAGELPRADVVKKQGQNVTETELQHFVIGLVAPHMKLRGGVEFVAEIPRSLSGKILRKILRQIAILSK